jgi:WD40 repeat protein
MSRRSGLLWSDPARLALARQLQSAEFPGLNRIESEFVQASIRRARRTRIIRGTVAMALVVITALASWTAYLARERQLVAVSRQLSAEAQLEPNQDTALLLSVLAHAVSATPEARGALWSSLIAVPHAVKYLQGVPVSSGRIRFEPGGQRLLTFGANELQVWSVDGRIITKWPIPEPSLKEIFFVSPQTVLTVHDDGGIGRWDVESHQLSEVLQGTGKGKTRSSSAFCSDRRLLIHADEQGHVKAWDTGTWSHVSLPSINLGADPPTMMACASDGKFLAIARASGALSAIELAKGKVVKHWRGQAGMAPKHVQFGARSSQILFAEAHGENTERAPWSLWAWNFVDEERPKLLTDRMFGLFDMVFAKTRNVLITNEMDQFGFFNLNVWSLANTAVRNEPLRRQSFVINDISISKDGSLLAVVGRDSKKFILDLAKNNVELLHKEGLSFDPESIAFQDKDCIVAGANNPEGVLRWLRCNNGEDHGETISGISVLSKVRLSPDGLQLAASLDDHSIVLRRTDDHPSNDCHLKGHKSHITQLLFLPDGNTLVSGDDEGHVLKWNLRTCSASLLAERGARIGALALGPVSSTLAIGDEKGYVTLITPGGQSDSYQVSNDSVRGIAYAPDEHILAFATRIPENDLWRFRLWSTRSKSAISPLLGRHSGPMFHLAFSRGGDLIFTSGADGTLDLWLVATHAPFASRIKGHRFGVQALTLSKDGRRLGSVAGDGSVAIWDVDETSWRGKACEVASRTFSSEEWRRLSSMISAENPCSTAAQ